MRRIRKIWMLIFGLLAVMQEVYAQAKVQVITKTIEQTFTYKPGDRVNLQGEKSNMVIHEWNKNEVKVVLKLIAKALDKKKASSELEYHKYILEKRKENINIKNYFLVPKGSQLKAILQAEYELWLPREAKLILQNNYGNITIDGILLGVEADFKYGTFKAEHLLGSSKFQGYFGDLLLSDLGGEFTIDLKHTESIIDNVNGHGKIKSTLGDVTIGNLTESTELFIEATKSDVDLLNIRSDIHFLKLRSEYGEVLVPDNFPAQVNVVSEDLNILEYGNEEDNKIEVKASFGNIILEIE